VSCDLGIEPYRGAGSGVRDPTLTVKISNLTKHHGAKGDSTPAALRDVTFEVPEGAFVTLLGPSGCGKSTLLNLVAGLDRPTAGAIAIGGRVVCDTATGTFIASADRNISMVFQSYAIWPHMTVWENIEFPLKHGRKRNLERVERDEVVARALAKVRLTAFRDRLGPLLSGGQQQRVSLARALAQHPALILLDEPLSNLDASLREEMQKEIRTIVSEFGITALYVTHDQKEALSMSDLIVVMKEGEVAQIGAPREIYYKPRNQFVAQFMGSPNLIEAIVEDEHVDGGVSARSSLGLVRIEKQHDCPVKRGDAITLVLRQEDIVLCEPGVGPSINRYDVTITRDIFLGDHRELICHAGDDGRQTISVYANARVSTAGKSITLHLSPEKIHYFKTFA
jgi:iron(III) transport system ATP-binding protein